MSTVTALAGAAGAIAVAISEYLRLRRETLLRRRGVLRTRGEDQDATRANDRAEQLQGRGSNRRTP